MAPHGYQEDQDVMWKRVMDPSNDWTSEIREVVWLASVVGGLSIFGIGVAVILAFAIDRWASLTPAAAG